MCRCIMAAASACQPSFRGACAVTAGLTPIQLFLSEQHVRAWPGGVGDCKMGSNYAPTVLPQTQAMKAYETPQVLYTLPSGDPDNPDSALISESGAMNVFFLLDKVACWAHAAWPASHVGPSPVWQLSAMNCRCERWCALQPLQADGSGQMLVTPPLDGTILPGVTRDSILALARMWNDCEVSESYLSIADLKEVRRPLCTFHLHPLFV
jgi:branched-chain amino acid aminotransferase